MKLSKWIFKKINEYDKWIYNTIPNEEMIEKWLLEYKEKYKDADDSL